MGLKMMSYEWKINDPEMVECIKNAKYLDNFVGPFFEMFGFKWYLEFIPCPYDKDDKKEEERKRSNETSLRISLAAMTPNIKSISIYYELSLKQIQTSKYKYYTQFTNRRYDMSVRWRPDTLYRTALETEDIKELTFKVKIGLIDVWDKDDKNIVNAYLHLAYESVMMMISKTKNKRKLRKLQWQRR